MSDEIKHIIAALLLLLPILSSLLTLKYRRQLHELQSQQKKADHDMDEIRGQRELMHDDEKAAMKRMARDIEDNTRRIKECEDDRASLRRSLQESEASKMALLERLVAVVTEKVHHSDM